MPISMNHSYIDSFPASWPVATWIKIQKKWDKKIHMGSNPAHPSFVILWEWIEHRIKFEGCFSNLNFASVVERPASTDPEKTS